MSKLTKADRHQVYKDALAYFMKHYFGKKRWGSGLCFCIGEVIPPVKYTADIGTLFPEFRKQKPAATQNIYWWNFDAAGDAARKKVLKQCIRLTAPIKRTK